MKHFLTAMVGLLTSLLLACGQPSQHDGADPISRSDSFSLSAAQLESYLAGKQPEYLQFLKANQTVQMDLILDLHSNSVLAQHAEKRKLHLEPKVKTELQQAREKILVNAYLTRLKEEHRVDQEALVNLAQDEYEKKRDQFVTKEKRRIAHILFSNSPSCACETRPALERAQAVRAQIKGLDDFPDFARDYSDDMASASAGGELPEWLSQDGQLDPRFEHAAFKQPIGTISEPVESPFGYHLIAVLDVKPARSISFDEVKDDLIRGQEGLARSSVADNARAKAYPLLKSIDYTQIEKILERFIPAPTPVVNTQAEQ